jgi:hypothetical protein
LHLQKEKNKIKEKIDFFFSLSVNTRDVNVDPLLLLLLVLLFLIDVKCLTFVDSVDWTALRDSILPTLGLPRLPATTPPPECPGNATEHVALSCDKSGRVQSLHVSRVVLRGSLSGRIGALSELRELVLRDTLAVRGALPAEIAALSLRRFVVPANAISGTLRFLNVAQLAELDVRDNAMSGQLPPPAALVQLERIDVSGNYFTELPGSRREWAELGAQLVECRVSQFNVTPIDNSDNCWLPRDCELLPPSCTCSLSRDPERCAPFNVPTTLPPNGTATLVATTPPLSSVFTVPTTTLVPCDLRRTCRDCVAYSLRSVNSSTVEMQNDCFWCYVEDASTKVFCSRIVRGVEPTCLAELKPYLVTCPVGERVVDWSVLIVTAVLLSLALLRVQLACTATLGECESSSAAHRCVGKSLSSMVRRIWSISSCNGGLPARRRRGLAGNGRCARRARRSERAAFPHVWAAPQHGRRAAAVAPTPPISPAR